MHERAAKKGAALAAALMLLLAAGVFVAISAALATGNAGQSIAYEQDERAHYLALSGCEMAWARLKADPILRSAVMAGEQAIYGDASGAVFTVKPSEPCYSAVISRADNGAVTVKSTGYFEQASSSVAASFTISESGVGGIVWSKD